MNDTISKSKLITYLADLELTYSPVSIEDGKWIGGDEKLFLFVKALHEEIERW